MSDKESVADSLKFKYVIPDHLQDCYVNGLWGAITPRNEVAIHFFSERLPIPNNETYKLTNGNLSPTPIERKSGGDVVRLVQSSLIMDITTAISLKTWLDNQLSQWTAANKLKNEKNDESDAK